MYDTSEIDRDLSPNEVGIMLGVTPEAVKQWLYSGQLKGFKFTNGRWNIKASALNRFLRARFEAPQPVILSVGFDGRTIAEFEVVSKRLGWEACDSNNATDALLKLKASCPTAVLINVDAEGCWTFLQKARRLRAGRHVPVMLFGHEPLDSPLTEEAMRLGVRGFLRLPIASELLARELQQLCKA